MGSICSDIPVINSPERSNPHGSKQLEPNAESKYRRSNEPKYKSNYQPNEYSSRELPDYQIRQYSSFLTKRGNIVWIGSMSLAWKQFASINHLDALQFKEPINQEAFNTIKSLNNSSFTKDSISSESIYVKAGFGPATQSTINQEVRQKFPNFSFRSLQYKLDQKSLIAFAYLYKRLSFKTQFKKLPDLCLFNNEKKLKFFYAHDWEQREQVRVGFYQDRDNFCVSIFDHKQNEVMHLLKKSEVKTVKEALTIIKNLSKNNFYGSLDREDRFMMPEIDIDCQRQYREMSYLELKKPGNQMHHYYIGVMKEALKLKIDESGARVESMAVMAVPCYTTSAGSIPQSRDFILDKTFWVVMQERGKHPYLCVQIVDPKDDS